MSHKKIILCFVNYYIPGFRSGGPTRTIANFADHLGEEFDIKIICCDRDLNDNKSFSNIHVDDWNNVGKTKVFYASPNTINLLGISKILRETPHDVLYLNSFFSYGFAIIPLLAQLLRLTPKVSCVIGPRGEFSKGALALKTFKKRAFMYLARFLGLYKNLYWQASSQFELLDIKREFGQVAKKIIVARDLTPHALISQKEIFNERIKGPLRIIFLSRISPMKNLDYLIRVISKISKDVELNIFGPKEDSVYWNKCHKSLKELPQNIKVNIGEEVPHEKVFNTFSKNDLFVFPTKGEALGHIILESLTAATPVLVSDKTSWQSDDANGLQAIPLIENEWIHKINEWINLTDDEIFLRRKAALNYANKSYLNNLESIDENKKLFYSAAKNKH